MTLDRSDFEPSSVETQTVIDVPLSPPRSLHGDQRPHGKKDDSTHEIDGARQATISQICTMTSIEWGEAFIKMQGTNSAQSLTMVRIKTQ